MGLPHLLPYGDGDNWILLEDFSFVDKNGTVITVPAKFITDFASIPRPFWNLVGPPWGKYGFAAIIHDWLYYSQTTTREYADGILKEGMIAAGVPELDVFTIFQGVDKGGQSAWNENTRKVALGFLRIAQDLPTSIWDRPFTWIGSTGNWSKG